VVSCATVSFSKKFLILGIRLFIASDFYTGIVK
jgi:hypothetical protein